jgi:hypothetical protein
MLVNFSSNTLGIEKLKGLPHQFFLGGSRRMAVLGAERGIVFALRPGTDYDFYATWEQEVVADLKNAGFTKTSTEYEYYDDETVAIMIMDDVQIVLRKDAEFYSNVFENINPQFFHDYLWKSGPNSPSPDQIRNIFNQLFQTAHGATEQIRKLTGQAKPGKTVLHDFGRLV